MAGHSLLVGCRWSTPESRWMPSLHVGAGDEPKLGRRVCRPWPLSVWENIGWLTIQKGVKFEVYCSNIPINLRSIRVVLVDWCLKVEDDWVWTGMMFHISQWAVGWSVAWTQDRVGTQSQMRAWCVILTAKIAKSKKIPELLQWCFMFFIMHKPPTASQVSVHTKFTFCSFSIFFRPNLPRFPELTFKFVEDMFKPDLLSTSFPTFVSDSELFSFTMTSSLHSTLNTSDASQAVCELRTPAEAGEDPWIFGEALQQAGPVVVPGVGEWVGNDRWWGLLLTWKFRSALSLGDEVLQDLKAKNWIWIGSDLKLRTRTPEQDDASSCSLPLSWQVVIVLLEPLRWKAREIWNGLGRTWGRKEGSGLHGNDGFHPLWAVLVVFYGVRQHTNGPQGGRDGSPTIHPSYSPFFSLWKKTIYFNIHWINHHKITINSHKSP